MAETKNVSSTPKKKIEASGFLPEVSWGDFLECIAEFPQGLLVFIPDMPNDINDAAAGVAAGIRLTLGNSLHKRVVLSD